MANLIDFRETFIHKVKWKYVSTAMKTHFNSPAYIIIILINIRLLVLFHDLKAYNTKQPFGY